MKSFFDPKSVVVIGASDAPFNLGATICNMPKHYLNYTSAVYVVNSKGDDINDYPGFTSVADLPGVPDLAVIRTKHRIPLFETTGQAARALSVSHTYFESLLKRKFIRGSALHGDCGGAEAAS